MRKKDLKQKSLVANNYWLSSRDGFTLIEVLIYMVLVGVTIGSSIAVVFNVIESSGSLSQTAAVEENANFVFKKVEWALFGAEEILTPGPGQTAASVSINKFGFGSNPITFTLEEEEITMQTSGAGALPLNSELTPVGSLSFEHIAESGDKPTGLRTTFTLDNKEYSTLIYLRQ